MKQGLLLLFLLFSSKFIYSQSLLNDLKTIEKDNSTIYNLLNINDKKSIIIQYSSYGDSSIPVYTYYIVLSKNKMFAYTYITLEDNLKELENGNLLDNKNYTHKFKNGFIRRRINEFRKKIKQKKYLQLINQKDLDIDYSNEGVKKMLEQGDAYYSDCGLASIEFYQGEKYYKLQVECSNKKMGRDKDKLDLFNELYKLLNDTWNIENSLKGRFIENKVKQE
jgi:hypothetical protein